MTDIEHRHSAARQIPSLLVVAGETSGDRAAAAVLMHLAPGDAFGIGGESLREGGVRLIADVANTGAMGLSGPLQRAKHIFVARRHILHRLRKSPPTHALLVGFSDFNQLLLQPLRDAGVRTVWYGPPQAWAWRPSRAPKIAKENVRLALMLPFEEAFWRRHNADAAYVGHPSCELQWASRRNARDLLAMNDSNGHIALLPGSRAEEVSRLLPTMLDTARACPDVRFTLILAPNLPGHIREKCETLCDAQSVKLVAASRARPIESVLPAFDASICASGTASLESALAGVPPIVVAKMGILTIAIARRMVSVKHIALPNLILERRMYPEFIQENVNSATLARELRKVLSNLDSFHSTRDELWERLGRSMRPTSSVRDMLTS